MSKVVSSISSEMLELLKGWNKVFPSEATHQRAARLALASCMNPGRKTVSNAIVHSGKDQQDWSGDYKVFSRSEWEGNRLFVPAQEYWIQNHKEKGWTDYPLICPIDSSNMKKTGKKIPYTQYYRDPMSPPFHVNLQWGQRILQMSGLVPSNGMDKGPARAIPMNLKICPRPRKPGKKATEHQLREYKDAVKRLSLPQISLEEVQSYREHLNELGARDLLLLMLGDGAFANKKIYATEWEAVAWLCRTRKDMALYYPWDGDGRRRKYGKKAPTPQELRADKDVAWKETEVQVGDHRCRVKYKSMEGMLWKSARGKKVRILVINGLPYRPPGAKKKSYRDPAYLSYIGPDIEDYKLVQWYIWRMEIEVNFRDEKQLFGLGHAQVWSDHSVARHPQFVVAVYAFLLVAAITAYGFQRGDFYLPLPKWYQKQPWQRPSTQEILNKFRAEILSELGLFQKIEIEGFVDNCRRTRSLQNFRKPA